MQPIQTGHICTKTDLKDLDLVLAWFEQFQRHPDNEIPEDVWLQCQLALVEGFTNAVRYAHRDFPPETSIELELAIFANWIEIKIWDQGPGFDMSAWLETRPQVADKDAEGGRGVRLMAKISDRLHYTLESDGRNCLYIGKRYSSTTQTTLSDPLQNIECPDMGPRHS